MSSKLKGKNLVAALDIGSTKVVCVIGEKTSEGLNIIGLGQVDHAGVSGGSIVHIEETAKVIQQAREEAELMAGVVIDSVSVGLGGEYVQSFDSSGMVAIRGKKVTKEDVERVLEMAQAVALPSDRQVIHILPSGYQIDYQKGIQNPIGMSGVRLECAVRIVTGYSACISNITQCVERAGLKIKHMVLQSLASSLAILSEDEKQMGVAVVDVGGGSCDMMVYKKGRVIYTGSMGVGGQNITYDVAVGLKTTRASAEELKKTYGSVLKDSVSFEEVVEVKSMGGGQMRNVSRQNLCEIIEARVQETFELMKTKLVESGLITDLGSGIVFTGGAVSLKGFMEMAEFVFDVPLRLGRAYGAGGLTDVVKLPQFSTAVGLLMYAVKEEEKNEIKTQSESNLKKSFQNLFYQVRDMFEDSK